MSARESAVQANATRIAELASMAEAIEMLVSVQRVAKQSTERSSDVARIR